MADTVVNRLRSTFEEGYVVALQGYLASHVEERLQAGYELGRQAVARRMGVLGVVEVHQMAMTLALEQAPSDQRAHIHQSGFDFLREALAPYEMVTRGMAEANERLERVNRKLSARSDELAVANRELDRARAAALDVARLKSEFLANMSHEIRTPMNAVIGMAYVLLDTELSAQQRSFVEIIRSSGESLMTLLDDILDLSKIEAGRMTLQEVPCDLLLIVEDVSAQLAMSALRKGLELVVDWETDAPRYVLSDPGRLRQVFTNLIGNAVKFTSSGHVFIHGVGQKKNGRLCARVTVEDTGIGIDPTRLPYLFEKFEQADQDTSRRFGGTGLGLAITRQLVEMMGGHIEAASEVGHGSRFTVALCLAPDAEPVPVRALSHLQGVRAIVIDGQPLSRRVLGRQLRHFGMRVDSVSSESEAVRFLRKAHGNGDPYQIAIVDCKVGSADGYSIAKRLKEDPLLEDLPLVLLTTLEQAGTRPDGRLFAATALKPVRPSELPGVVSRVISRR